MDPIRTAARYAEKVWAAIYRRRGSALDSLVTGIAEPGFVVAVVALWFQYRSGG
ncbi:hypothetical protein [Streptomyces virginiae]|uniref:hypothetical protein n=1 Tax=Streptomyces virginiae TaxID=1961 RepID=UPI0036E8EB66